MAKVCAQDVAPPAEGPQVALAVVAMLPAVDVVYIGVPKGNLHAAAHATPAVAGPYLAAQFAPDLAGRAMLWHALFDLEGLDLEAAEADVAPVADSYEAAGVDGDRLHDAARDDSWVPEEAELRPPAA